MSEGKFHDFDVIVIGAGMAGLRAALASAETGARTAIICKSFLAAETASGMAGGGFVYPSADLPPDEYMAEVAWTGRGLNDRRLLAQLARDGEADFHDAVRRFGWKYVVRDRYQSTLRDGVVPGYHTTLSIARAAVQAGVLPFENHTVIRLWVDGGRCRGCLCLDQDGTPVWLRARAMVLTTGGYASIFALHDNPPRSTGDGHVLAVEAGCRLRDLEFVQFYPLGLDDRKLPHYMVGLPFPPGTRLLDENGDDVIARNFPAGTDMYTAAKNYRDHLSIVILKEKALGHTPQVDLSQTNREVWEQFSITRLLPLWGRDPVATGLPVSPIAHFTMGGVVVDPNLETDVKGLFAAGEVAGGVHGANRFAANALLGCLVHGRLAGEAAARTAAAAGEPAEGNPPCTGYLLGYRPVDVEQPADCGEDGLRRARNQLQQLCGRYLSPLRSAASLQAGLEALAGLGAAIERLQPGRAQVRLAVELRAAVTVAAWTMRAALSREESRGAHYRDDFPESDDARWLRPIIVEPAHEREAKGAAVGALPARFVVGSRVEVA